MGRNNFQKALKHLKSTEVDKKIDELNEMMTTKGIYVVTRLDDGTPATPDTPAVPPTYVDVDEGGITGNGDDFEWPDQGDGNPDNDPVIPTNLYTTYNGEQIPALRYIDTYNGELLDYGDHPPIGAVAIRGGWLDWDYIGYVAGSGVRMVGTTRYPNGDIGNAIYSAYRNWPFPGKIVKTVYQWQSIDCLFGSCKGASQYYPSGTTNSSSDGSPLAERALYAWTVWLPADAEGNLIRNRVQTDPGTPLIPGDPAIPPAPFIFRQDDLGDPNFFPGDVGGFLATLLNIGKRAYDYITNAAGVGGGPTPTSGPTPTPTPTPRPTPTPTPDETPEIPPGGAMVKTDTGYTVLNAKQFAAYAAGGGAAAIDSGKSFQDVMNQGYTNISNLNRKTKVNPNEGQSVFQSIAGTVADVITTGVMGVPVATVLKSLNQVKNTLPGVGTRVDIATSMISGKPVVYNEKDIPQYQKDALLNNIAPGTVSISYGEEQPYSDDNIVVDKNGNVRPNDGSSPNLTQPTSYKSSGFMGTDNPLHAAGQAQQQFVVPSDGSEPYYVYTDHAYYNASSKDPGEINQGDKLSPVIANTLQAVTPGMKGYPPNIKGDVVKTFRVPYSKLPQNAKDVIDKELQYQDFVRSGKATKVEQVLHEEWQSPKHTNIEKDQRKRWFNPADIKPEYPEEPPAPMIGGHSIKSLAAPRKPDRDPIIKITKKDLLRNHRLKDSEIEEMMDIINKINDFLSAHPEELIYARQRYPKSDPRLAELNWKMDQQLSASNEYMERHFPENQKLFNKLQKSIKKNIELTDPKNFKVTPKPLRYVDIVEEPNERKSVAKFIKKPKKRKKHPWLREKKK